MHAEESPDKVGMKEYFRKDGANEWWDKTGESVPVKAGMVSRSLREGLILDVCIGKGRMELSFPASTLENRSFVGIDISILMLREAKKRLEASGLSVELLQCDAESLPFASRAFNSTFCVEALMHVPDTEATLQEMSRVTKKTTADSSAGTLILHFNMRRIRKVFALLGNGRIRDSASLFSGYYLRSVRTALGLKTIWKAFGRGRVEALCSKLGKFQELPLDSTNSIFVVELA
jgi:ubiquinone/menaquinone biosynthesis C-methylase UbiE